MNLVQLADKINKMYGAEVIYEDPSIGGKESWMLGFLLGLFGVDEGVDIHLIKTVEEDMSTHYIINIKGDTYEVESSSSGYRLFEVAPAEVIEYVRLGRV